MKEVVIASACRTPIGRFQGSLSGLRAPELGALAISEALRRAGVEAAQVEEVILGNVLQAGVGQNPARQAARGAGVPDEVGSFTVNKVCGSGLKAVMLGAQAIRAGDLDVAVCGGMESMTQAPYLLPEARGGVRLGHGRMLDAMVHDGLWDIYNDFHMGMTGELVADKYEVTREAQDEFAARSHNKAEAAEEAGRFAAERFPVMIPQRKSEPVAFEKDEGIRAGATPEGMAKLRPAFKREGGTVTAGNASSINDGASALVVMSAERAAALGVKPLARVLSYATGGCGARVGHDGPREVRQGLRGEARQAALRFRPARDQRGLLGRGGGVDAEVLDLDADKVNVNGGAVALGPPDRGLGRADPDHGCSTPWSSRAPGPAWPRCVSEAATRSRSPWSVFDGCAVRAGGGDRRGHHGQRHRPDLRGARPRR